MEKEDSENEAGEVEDPPVENEKEIKKKKKAKQKKIKALKEQAAKEVKQKEKSMKRILYEKRKAEERKNKFTEADQLSRLEKYDLEDSKDADNNPFIADEKFKGPTPYRKQTDWLWIILFIILNLGLVATAYLSISNGDLNRLTTGYDFRSALCGVDKFVDKPYVYFINPVLDINVAICVAHCPSSTGDTICLYKPDGVTPTSFCYIQMQTTYSGKYCFPVEPINHEIVDTYLNSFYNSVRRTVTDFFIAREVIAYGVIIAVVLPLLILFLLKRQKTVAIVAWASIFLTFAVIGGAAYIFWEEYQAQLTLSCPFSVNSDCAGWKPKLYYAMFIIICVFGGLYLLIILRLVGRITLAIGILKAASKTNEVLSQLRVIPIVMTILGLAFGSLTIFIILKSFGCGEVEVITAKNIDGGEVKTIYWSAYIQWLIVYNILMLFYWLLAILGYSDLITSYALAIWFFVKNKETVDIPVKRSFRDITKYHLGTLFFGSWANTVLGVPKMIMSFVTRALRKSKQHSNSVRFLTATCMSCIYVYQKLLRYISKNAVVQTSLWGDNYYHSAKKSFFLLFRNAHLTKDLDYLQSFLILQTKLVVCFVSSAVTYAYLKIFKQSYIFNDDLNDLQSPFAPTIIVFFIAFFLSSLIQGSFDITCKTIIQCYLIDCEMFIGEQRYAEDFIRHFMEFFVKNSQKKIFVTSTKKPTTNNTIDKGLSDSYVSDEDPNEQKEDANKKNQAIDEEDEEDDEEEDDSEEESEEDSEENEDSQAESDNSEEVDEDEKKKRDEDLENLPRDSQNRSEKFIHDDPNADVEFYDGKNDDENESDNDENEKEQSNEGENLNEKPALSLNNNNSFNNFNSNNKNNASFNKNNLNGMPNNNTMANENIQMPQNKNKNFWLNDYPPKNNYPPNNNFINNANEEGAPLNEKDNEEWKLVNLNNHSYDHIKDQVFNLMDNKKEEKSFNFFDKSQVNDSTWKFEDPFDMPASKNYRIY